MTGPLLGAFVFSCTAGAQVAAQAPAPAPARPTYQPYRYDEEAIVQRGRFGSAPIRAWALASDQGVSSIRMRRARLGVRVFATSGDRDPTDSTRQTFDPLFPGIAYSGKAGLIGPTNLVTLSPSFAMSPLSRVRLTVDWARFWRTSARDGLYGINVALLRSSVGTDARAVGSQATVEVDVRLTTHVSVWTAVTAFRTGRFLAEAAPGEDLRYLAAHAAYRF
jgi:hypothetical protein